MMSITLVDSGDRDGMMLRMNVNKALAKTGIKAEVVVVDARRGYRLSDGVDKAPALLIDGDMIVQGGCMKAGEVAAELTRHAEAAASDAAQGTGEARVVAIPCGGCKHNCDLRHPSCGVGVEKARRMGLRFR